MAINTIYDYVAKNDYPGRGIFIGESADGENMVVAYFIMGRSDNSRNRIFALDNQGNIRTQAYDCSKMIDPSLIIYSPIKHFNGNVIVSNGDQTDTIYNSLSAGKTFWEALELRTFEPDPPHFTPRISGMVFGKEKNYAYYLSILKSNKGNESQLQRQLFSYIGKKPGTGHFIHTYEKQEGNRLATFNGEPVELMFTGDINTFATSVWKSLNEDNKIALGVQFINKTTRNIETKVINKHHKKEIV